VRIYLLVTAGCADDQVLLANSNLLASNLNDLAAIGNGYFFRGYFCKINIGLFFSQIRQGVLVHYLVGKKPSLPLVSA